MYKLTLSADERKAIDFVGNRYSNGDELYRCLWVNSECAPDGGNWYDPGDISFYIPEHIAWRISDIADADNNLWPLFSPELKEKMAFFVDSIV